MCYCCKCNKRWRGQSGREHFAADRGDERMVKNRKREVALLIGKYTNL